MNIVEQVKLLRAQGKNWIRNNIRITEEETMSRVDALMSERMERGQFKYGQFEPETDKRDLVHEALEEAVDLLNYLRMREAQVEVQNLRISLPEFAYMYTNRLRVAQDKARELCNIIIGLEEMK